MPSVLRAGEAHDERRVREEAVADAEDGGPHRPAAARAVPLLPPGDGLDGLHFRPLQAGEGAAVLALVGRDGLRRLVLGHVHVVGPGLHAADDGQDRPDPEAPGQEADDAHPQAGPVLPGLDAGLAELLAPDVGVPILDGGELGEDGLAVRIAFGLGQQAVQSDAVDLVVQVGLEDPERLWVGGRLGFLFRRHVASQRLTGVCRRSAPKEHYTIVPGPQAGRGRAARSAAYVLSCLVVR